MEGFPLDTNHVAMNADGSIDPAKHLYRANFVGVDKGPYLSQVRWCGRPTLNNNRNTTSVGFGHKNERHKIFYRLDCGAIGDVFFRHSFVTFKPPRGGLHRHK